MHRDPLDSQMLFFEVTAQVPAVHGVAVSEQDRFAFPPEIWTAVQAAIRLRGRGEIRGGWWHSHPAFAFCEDCPPDRRAHCPWRDPNGFFSDADRVLHRGAFVRAYHVGLVATHIDGDVWLAGFGWRKGQIVRRGLRVIGARRGYEPGGARGCLVSRYAQWHAASDDYIAAIDALLTTVGRAPGPRAESPDAPARPGSPTATACEDQCLVDLIDRLVAGSGMPGKLQQRGPAGGHEGFALASATFLPHPSAAGRPRLLVTRGRQASLVSPRSGPRL